MFPLAAMCLPLTQWSANASSQFDARAGLQRRAMFIQPIALAPPVDQSRRGARSPPTWAIFMPGRAAKSRASHFNSSGYSVAVFRLPTSGHLIGQPGSPQGRGHVHHYPAACAEQFQECAENLTKRGGSRKQDRPNASQLTAGVEAHSSARGASVCSVRDSAWYARG